MSQGRRPAKLIGPKKAHRQVTNVKCRYHYLGDVVRIGFEDEHTFLEEKICSYWSNVNLYLLIQRESGQCECAWTTDSDPVVQPNGSYKKYVI